MRAIVLGSLSGMLIGVVLAIAIVLIFNLRSTNAAFIVGAGCGVVGSYVGTYIMVRKS